MVCINQEHKKAKKKSYIGVLKIPVQFLCMTLKSESGVQALRLCTGRTAHRGSRGIALPFLDHGTRRG
jgi:hypothetical protein